MSTTVFFLKLLRRIFMNRIDTRGKDEENKEKRKIRQEKVKKKKNNMTKMY